MVGLIYGLSPMQLALGRRLAGVCATDLFPALFDFPVGKMIGSLFIPKIDFAGPVRSPGQLPAINAL